MNITFFLSIYEKFFDQICQNLKKSISDLECSGISYGRLGPENISKSQNRWNHISVFTDYVRKKGIDQPFDIGFLKQKEEELGMPNLSFYISADRYISKLPYAKAVRMLELCIKFVEESLECQKPEVILIDDVCCMLSYLIYKIGKKRGLPVLSLGSVKLNHRLSIYDDALDRRSKIEKHYAELKNRDLTPDEQQTASSYLGKYIQQYEPLLYLKTRSKVPRFTLNSAWSLIRFSLNHLKDPLDVSRMNFLELTKHKLMRIVRHHLAYGQNYFEQPQPLEPYVFYPLQAQPERSTLILAPFYCDQLALIENISKSLPIGYKLYVKDHPIFLGRRPLRELRRIKSIYNVKLLDTQLPSETIVKNASIVITISNTIGIEAILFEKPLIILGDVFYKMYRNACYLENLKELPHKIKQLLDTFKPDRQELLKFITALLRGTYSGTRRQPDAVPEVLSEKNIDEVSKAILQELTQLSSTQTA